MPEYSDDEIISALNTYMYGSEHPDLEVYREKFLDLVGFQEDGGKRFVWGLKYVCKLGRLTNSRILDIGCGFGWDALTVSMLGNNRVVALDILPSVIEGLRECVKSLEMSGAKFDITPMVGDICHTELEPESFDAVCSFEAIEHVHDLGSMFDKCASLLRPGGRLVVMNDSNQFNASCVNATFGMWTERDHSWEHAAFLKTVRPVEHRDAKPYAVMREKIVRKANPNLDDVSCSAIANATAGLVEHEIIEIAKNYRSGVELCTPPEFSWCRNPVTGEYAERLLNPFEIADLMRHRGFKTKVFHAFRKFPISLTNKIQFKPVNRFLFNLRPIFVLVGRKK